MCTQPFNLTNQGWGLLEMDLFVSSLSNLQLETKTMGIKTDSLKPEVITSMGTQLGGVLNHLKGKQI